MHSSTDGGSISASHFAGKRTSTTADAVAAQPKIEVFDIIFTLPLFHHNAIAMGTHSLDVSGKSIAEGAVDVRLGRRAQLRMRLRPQENAVVPADPCRRPPNWSARENLGTKWERPQQDGKDQHRC